MAIYKGSTKIKSVYFGGTKIGKIYKGNQLVYQSKSSPKYLCYIDDGPYALTYYYCKYPATINSGVFIGGNNVLIPTVNSSELVQLEGESFTSFSGDTAIITYSGGGGFTVTRSPENDLYE